MNNLRELAVSVCEHVVANIRPIKLVIHNHDNTWECMCGEIDHLDFIDSKIIGLNSLIEFDNSILPIKQLPIGCVAERNSINAKWNYYVIEE